LIIFIGFSKLTKGARGEYWQINHYSPSLPVQS